MDRFITRFALSDSEVRIVTQFSSMSLYWSCSHRDTALDCRIFGICARENFVECCTETIEREDAETAAKLVHIASKAMDDRSKTWCIVLRRTKYWYPEDPAGAINLKIQQVAEKYEEIGLKEKFRTFKLTRISHRTTIDDSFSMMHAFYIPINTFGPPTIVRMARFRQTLICYYINLDEPNGPFDIFLPPCCDEAKQILAPILREGRKRFIMCPVTDDRRPLKYVAWLRAGLLNVINNRENQMKINLMLEMDAKFINMMKTDQAKRFCTQKFGFKGSTMADIDFVMLGLIRCPDGTMTNIVKHRVNTFGSEAWETWATPQLSIRMYQLGELPAESIIRCMDGVNTCQICHANTTLGQDHIPLINTRLSSMFGVPEIQYARAIGHEPQNHSIIDITNLWEGEVLVRSGEHWMGQHCDNSGMAIIVTASMLHKYIRARGIWTNREWRLGMSMLARLIFYWNLDDDQIITVFKLTCFVCFGHEPISNNNEIDWSDLGKFLDLMCRHEQVSSKVCTEISILLFDLGRLVLSLIYSPEQEHFRINQNYILPEITNRFEQLAVNQRMLRRSADGRRDQVDRAIVQVIGAVLGLPADDVPVDGRQSPADDAPANALVQRDEYEN
nr:NS1 [Letea virus]QIQ51207.1 NS1 [Letea virus]